MSMPGKYIYCFIKERESINICSSSFANIISPVYTLPYHDISAVVSNTDVYEFDPTRKNIINHQKIITKVMENYTVVPVAFGTVSNNKKDIEYILENNYDKLLKQLEMLEGKSEVGLKITWNDDFFNQDIEDNEIKALKKKVSGKEEEEVLYDKIQLGKLVQAEIEKRKQEYSEKIYEPLSKFAVDSKVKEGIPIKTILVAYFLVNNSDSENFDNEVEKLSQAYSNKLVFSYTGPWPPYNFVDIRINLDLCGE